MINSEINSELISVRSRAAALTLSLTLCAIVALAAPARALEEQAGEADAIKGCEQRICTMLLQKTATGGDLKCALTKTWAQSTIKDAESRTVKWSWGDARCTVDLHVPRALIAAAMTEKTYKFHLPPTTARCVVEQDGAVRPVTAILSPKIVFKDGKAEKVWVNLKSIEGPAAIKLTLQTAASMEDTLGLFQRPMLKAINRFIGRHCPAAYPQATAAKAPGK